MLEVIKDWILSKFHVCEWETIREEESKVYRAGCTPKNSLPIHIYRTYIQQCKRYNKMRRYRFDI